MVSGKSNEFSIKSREREREGEQEVASDRMNDDAAASASCS